MDRLRFLSGDIDRAIGRHSGNQPPVAVGRQILLNRNPSVDSVQIGSGETLRGHAHDRIDAHSDPDRPTERHVGGTELPHCHLV